MFREAKYMTVENENVRLVTVDIDEMAEKFGRSVSSKEKIFVCPDCCEYVAFVYCTSKSSYFKHEKSDGKRKCELYIQRTNNNQNYSPYERVGLPLYLIRRDNNFSLNIGFYPINKQTIEASIKHNLSFEIYAMEDLKNKIAVKYVNEESFSSESTVFIPITKESKEYRLNFSHKNLPAEINEKWNYEIEGLESKGTFFKFYENGGMKIRRSEEITLRSDYYLLCKENPSMHIDKAECEKVGDIYLVANYWVTSRFEVYKVRFTNITHRNFLFCQERNVLLVSDAPQLSPVWPPCTKEEQLLIYDTPQNAKFLLKTPEKTKNVVLHPNASINIEELDDRRAIVSIPIKVEERLVSIDRANAPFVFAVTAKHRTDTMFLDQVIVEDGKGTIYSAGEYTKLASNNEIKITANFKGKIYVYQNNILEKIIQINNSVVLDCIIYGTKIQIFHGLDSVFELKFKKTTEYKAIQNQVDEKLFNQLISYRGNTIIPSISLKYMVPKLKDYPMVSEFITNALKTGKIHKTAKYKLEMFIRKIGG